jgi:hypothetical protein
MSLEEPTMKWNIAKLLLSIVLLLGSLELSAAPYIGGTEGFEGGKGPNSGKNDGGHVDSISRKLASVTPTLMSLPIPSPRLSDTGQTKCWNSDGYEIPCAGSGQDGAYRIYPQNFTDNGDGTVTDNVTGLIWQQQEDNPNTLYNWYQAAGVYHATYNGAKRSACGETRTAGYSDWRLPSKRELIGIVDYSGLPGAAINSVFKNTNTYKYWTSTPTDFGPNDPFPNAWYVHFSYGESSNGDMNGGNGGNYKSYVRCVRGQSLTGVLTDNHDGTVTDTKTSLMWQQGGPPNYDPSYSWEGALNYCEALADGGYTDWRLPNVKELESLTVIDSSKFNPPIDKTLFPNARQWKYWTSTTFGSSWENTEFTKKAWTVDFTAIGDVTRGGLNPFTNACNGQPNDKSGCYFKYYARCVRSINVIPLGDPPACTLAASPAVVAAGGTSTLKATCNPPATSFAWGNSTFASTADSGTVSPTKPTLYTVVGSNVAGSGAAASTAVYVCNTAPTANYPGITFSGTGANDKISSGIASDTIDGGPGFDTVVYNCNKDAFTLTKTTSGWTVSSKAEGFDTLANVERIQFGDRTLALDISGNAGQAYRIYQAAFDRVPDNGGLKYWIGRMDAGTSLERVAAEFIGSPEFKALYGTNPTNAAFLTKLYNNVLHRQPDQGGYDWWLGELNAGRHTMTSSLMGFSESPENQAGVLNAIINGIDLLN